MTHRHNEDAPSYLTPAEAAKRLNVSARTLWRYQSAGKVTPLVLPTGHRRFLVEDIDRLLGRAS